MRNFVESIALFLLLSLILMGIWNELITDIFKLRAITFGEGILLFGFCNLVFKNPKTNKNSD